MKFIESFFRELPDYIHKIFLDLGEGEIPRVSVYEIMRHHGAYILIGYALPSLPTHYS